jgi:hypothetical protein
MSCGPLGLLTDRCLEIPRGYNPDKVKLAPGSDGFSGEFYQFFWEVVKPDLMELFMNSMLGDFLSIAKILG